MLYKLTIRKLEILTKILTTKKPGNLGIDGTWPANLCVSLKVANTFEIYRSI